MLGDNLADQRQADPNLIRLIVAARRWSKELQTGVQPSIRQIARSEGVDAAYVSRCIRLAFLAPDICQTIIDGTAPVSLTPERLRKACPLPSSWTDQRAILID